MDADFAEVRYIFCTLASEKWRQRYCNNYGILIRPRKNKG
jgi:hypothetical protein